MGSPYLAITQPNQPTVYAYEVADKSPVYSFSNGQARAERTFLFDWSARQAFVRGMLGYSLIRSVPGKTAPFDTYVQRQLPHFMTDILDPVKNALDIADYLGVIGDATDYPDSLSTPDGTWLFASAITRLEGVEPLGFCDDVDNVPQYNYALATVQYEPLTYKVLNDFDCTFLNGSRDVDAISVNGIDTLEGNSGPYEFLFQRNITRTIRPTTEFLAIPVGRMKWADPDRNYITTPPQQVNYASAVPVPFTEITWTWHQVPFVPDAVYTHVGTVNRYALQDMDLNRYYRAGTLLLLGAEIRPYRMGSGKFVVDVSYRVKHYDPFDDGRGHNHFLRYRNDVAKPHFTKLTDNGNGDVVDVANGVTIGDPNGEPGRPLFRYTDFRSLFSWHANPNDKPSSTNVPLP